MMAALDRPYDEVIAAFERASQLVPARAEALHAAARLLPRQGQECRRHGHRPPRHRSDSLPNGLFVQAWVYDYGILDEFAINAYWAGAYRESLDAALKLWRATSCPRSMVKRIAANARFALDKMPAAKARTLAGSAPKLVQQHALVPQRPLRSRVKDAPRVLLAILAKQKERRCRSTSSASRRSTIRNPRSSCTSAPTTTPTGPSRSCANGSRGSAAVRSC